jgi:fibronectin-binding autotransporter adhesin
MSLSMRSRWTRALMSAMCAAFACAPASIGSAQNLMANGTFETPTVTNNQLIAAGGTTFTGWTVDSASPANNGILGRTSLNGPSEPGSQCVQLSSHNVNAEGGLHQVISTIPGQSYEISIDYRSITNVETIGAFNFGSLSFGLSTSTTAWSTAGALEVASSASTLIDITGSPLANGGALIIDNVSVTLDQIPTVWSGSASSNWGTASNWVGTSYVPSGAGVAVSFGSPASNNSVNLGTASRTAGIINFANAAPTTIQSTSGAYYLILDNSSSAAAITVSGQHAINAGVQLNSNAAITMTSGSDQLTFGGSIVNGSSSSGITLSGSGTLVLAGSNTYSGNTSVISGTLQLSNSMALQNSTLTSGGIVFNSQVASHGFTLGGISGSASLALADNGGNPVALSIGNNGQSTTYGGILSGLGGLIKVGTGTLTLTSLQTYSGPTLISGGVLQLQSPQQSGTVGIGIHFVGSGSSQTGSAGVVPIGNWNNLTAINTSNRALTDSTGAATTATITVSGATENNGSSHSSIQILNGYNYNNANGAMSATISGIPYANYSLYAYTVDSAPGMNDQVMTIGGQNYYYAPDGGTTYNQITNTYPATFQTGNYVVATQLTGSSQTVTAQGDGSKYGSFASFEIVNNPNVLPFATPVTISNGGTLDMTNCVQSVASLSSTDGRGSQVLLGSGALTVAGPAVTTFDGAIAGAGGSLTLGGGGLTLTGTNTYSGATTISGGTLAIGGSGVLGPVSNGGYYGNTIANNGAMVVKTSSNQTFGGAITGSGALYQLGSGVTTLAAANSYSGPTAILAGVLALPAPASISQSPAISLGNGATLDVTAQGANFHLVSGQTLSGAGNYNVSGTMNADSGSFILPGGATSYGTLNIGALSLNSGGTLMYDFGSGRDLIKVANSNGLNLAGGGIDLYQADGVTQFSMPGTYTLMEYAGNLGGAAGNLSVLNPTASQSYAFTATGGSVNLTITNPNTWTGGNPSFKWSSPGNWSTLQVPSNGQTIAFSGTTGLSNTNDLTNLNLTGIFFSGLSGAFNLSGNSIQLAGPIANYSAATQTVGMNIGLVGGNQTINAAPGKIVLNGTVSDGGGGLGITTTGAGSVVLSAANTYSGPTNILAGVLNLAHPLAVQYSTVNAGSGASLTFAAGIVSPTLGGLAGSGNIALATTASQPVALNVGNNGQDTTYAGSLSGPGSLVKQGAGTLTLTSVQGYSGATLVAGGVLQLQPQLQYGIAVHFVGNQNGGSVTGLAGVIPIGNWNNLSGASFANQPLTDNTGAATTATITVSANGTYASGSSNPVLNGYIFNSSNNALSATISGIPYPQYSIYAYLVDSTQGYGEQFTAGGSSYYYSPLNTAAYAQITNTAAGTYPTGNYVVASGLTGANQTLTVRGISSQYGSFAGFEIVGAGAGGASLPATTAVTISNGATLDMTNCLETIASLSSTDGMGSHVLMGSGALTIAGTAVTTFDGVISGAAGSLILQSGRLILTGANTYAGATTISGGTLQLGAGAGGHDGSIANTSAVTDNASLVYNLNGNQAASYGIGGIGRLIKLGQGMLTLSGADTYVGGTFVSSGTLQLANPGALPVNGGLTVNGGIVDLNGSAGTVAGLSGSGGAVTDSSSVGSNVLTVNQSGYTTYRGTIQDGPATVVGLAVSGIGRLTLAGSNNYSGATTVYGCTLNAAATDVFSPNSAVTVDNGGTLSAAGFAQTVPSLTVGSLGILSLSIGNPLTSSGAAEFLPGSTLNISGSIVGLPELLMTCLTSFNGTFSNVNYNGTSLPGTDLSYSSGSLELVSTYSTGMPPASWVAGSGHWSSGSNWSSNTAPNGAGQPAVFNQSSSGGLTITLDVPVILGMLQFASSTTNYTLSAQGATGLTFSNSGTSWVTLLSGTHSIGSPVYITGGNLDISASNKSLLNIRGNIADDLGSRSLILSGDGSGQFVLSGANSYGGSTIVDAGTLIIDSAASLPDGSSLTVGQGASSLFAPAARQGAGYAAIPSVLPAPSSLLPVPEPGSLAYLLAALLSGVIYYIRLPWQACSSEARLTQAPTTPSARCQLYPGTRVSPSLDLPRQLVYFPDVPAIRAASVFIPVCLKSQLCCEKTNDFGGFILFNRPGRIRTYDQGIMSPLL